MGTLFVCVCGSFESLLHRQASKRVVQLLAKTNPNTAEKGWKKGKNKGISVLFFVLFFSISFFHAVAQEHCMFCGGAFCAWRRIASLVFLQRTLICVLGKRCIGSFLCVQMKQGAMNPLCRDA